MSIVDVIQSISVVITIILSIIGIIQSGKSNKFARKANDKADESNELSKEANDIARKANVLSKCANNNAEEALKDSKKDYMPLVRFVGGVDVVTKTIKELRNENTFDFDEIVLSCIDYDDTDMSYSESSELVCIEANIENCGTGIIKGMRINKFFIQEGNKISIKIESQEELDNLCNIEKECEEWFVLKPEEKTKINFMISKNLSDNMQYEDLYEAQNGINNFFNKYDNIMIGMDLHIFSLNDTSYEQDFLIGTALNKVIVHNSFEDVR